MSYPDADADADADSFAERLVKSEPCSEALRRRYEDEKLALAERRLTPLQRWLGWLAMPVYGGLILGLGYRLMTTDSTQPREWILLEAVSGLCLLAIGLWMLRVLLRGSVVTWRDDRAMEWIGGLGLCAMAFALFEVARSLEDALAALRLHGCITILLVGGAFGVLIRRIDRSKLEMRVKLVELELRLAELARAIRPSKPDPGTGGEDRSRTSQSKST